MYKKTKASIFGSSLNRLFNLLRTLSHNNHSYKPIYFNNHNNFINTLYISHVRNVLIYALSIIFNRMLCNSHKPVEANIIFINNK